MTPEEAYAIANGDPVLLTDYNVAQQRLFDAVRNPPLNTITLVILLKGNRAGGSYGLVSIWSAIMFGTRHRLFQGSPFGDEWPFRKATRLLSPIASLEDKGPLQTAMKELFPRGRFEQSKGSGHGYYSQGSTDTKWSFGMQTYDQTALQSAGANLGLVLMSEPPPASIFSENITRLSGNGMLIAEFTRLDMSAFIDEYVEAGALMLDGKKVGEIKVVTADIHDACREHSGGHMAHSSIEATIAAWPAEEREARKTGKPLKLSGRIYPEWGDHNELEALPEWHQEELYAGRAVISTVIDPADQKPWAVGYFATFQNNDVICVAEWPTFEFDSCKVSPIHDIEEYRDQIIEMEAALGLPVRTRLIDPLFGNAPGKGNVRTIRTMLAAPCRRCMIAAGVKDHQNPDEESVTYLTANQACKHKLAYSPSLAYDGSVRDGHILVRALLGSATVKPKLMTLKPWTGNMARGMRRYAWKPKKNPEVGEKPSLCYKDFPDLWRLGMLKRFNEYPTEPEPTEMLRPLAGGRWTAAPSLAPKRFDPGVIIIPKRPR